MSNFPVHPHLDILTDMRDMAENDQRLMSQGLEPPRIPSDQVSSVQDAANELFEPFQASTSGPSTQPQQVSNPPSPQGVRRLRALGCRCDPPPASQPSRHWKTSCPHNPAKGRWTCEGCGKEYTRWDNYHRHRAKPCRG